MECRKSMQVAVNGILTIPEYIPDIDFILRVTSTPIIENAIVIDKQISFSGHVLICVEMVSSKPDCLQTVHFISYETPFIGLMDHWCARASMDAQLNASIKHQEFKMLTPKCINKLIVIKISLLRLTKSCRTVNAHCSEPRLTLLCKIPPPSTSTAAQPNLTTPIQPIDFHSDSIDFHLPQTLENCNTEPSANASCSICGCKIDHV
ncbi:MAG: hypothetical protein H6Q68_2034 [Firmicutes bacterium]|nr:hypothetical protein [Bacillota bacterium]